MFERTSKGKVTAIKLVESDKVIFICYHPQLLQTKQLCEVIMEDKDYLGDKEPGMVKQAFMVDEWTIRLEFSKRFDFVNSRRETVPQQQGPFNQPNLQANYALKLRNKGDLHDWGKPNISKGAVLNKEIEDSFTVTQITGQPLKDFEVISERVVDF